MNTASIAGIRKTIASCKGREVRLEASGGRSRGVNAIGVLDGAYDGLFTVTVNENGCARRYSYTYSEVLTGNVVLRFIRRRPKAEG